MTKPRRVARNPSNDRLRVATYNVNGVNGRLPRLIEWLRDAGPDIACLQELKTDDTKFPIAAIRDQGYDAIWHGQRAHHGVAILARGEKPHEIRRGLPGDPTDVHTRYIEARVRGLLVASVYLPNGNPVGSPNYEYKLRWFERLIRYAEALAASDVPAVLAGDLNVVPTDRDIANPWWWRFDAVMQPEVRALYGRLLGQGWTDAARALHPTATIYTFWTTADAFVKNRGFRLDFLLVNAPLRGRLSAFGVDASFRGGVKPSDHAPAWIEVA
jgi:exodeoxyribonuclease-3